jgi:CubicO group peptidase (beta-lactamase class C family)
MQRFPFPRSLESIRRSALLCALSASVLGGSLLAAQAAAPAAGAPAVVAVPPAGSGLSAPALRKLDRLIEDSIAAKQLAGAVVLLKRDGKDVYLKPYGMQDIEAGKAMQTDAIFRIASMSKAVTTVAALMLYEEGRFMLKDPVGKYIPAFRNSLVAVPPAAGAPEGAKFSVVPAKRQITIRDLMCHTAGLSYGDGPAKELYEKADLVGWRFTSKDETIGDAIRRLGALPLNGQPGEAWMYGYSTDVLGYLVEVVSGMPLDKFIEERITKPLRMVDTSFYLPPEKVDRLMPVYGLQDGKLTLREKSADSDYVKGPRKCFSGGAGLLSTANDYGRFLQMLLNGGELDGVRVLQPKTVELMHQNHVGDKYSRDTNAFGLGFWVANDEGYFGEAISEGAYGWGSAFYPQYFVDPKERMIGVLFTQLMPAGGLDLNAKFKVLSTLAVEK